MNNEKTRNEWEEDIRVYLFYISIIKLKKICELNILAPKGLRWQAFSVSLNIDSTNDQTKVCHDELLEK